MADKESQSAKLLVAGGFGVGKTTFVTAISEIEPLSTEGLMTTYSADVDDGSLVPDKMTTTVALDFGRITVDEGLVLYLFGTPGQERFGFMWDDISRGALGATVLIDTRRLSDAFFSIDYFESREIPFVAAINTFTGAPSASLRDLRDALDLDPHVPLLSCDARDQSSVRETLISLLEHLWMLMPVR